MKPSAQDLVDAVEGELEPFVGPSCAGQLDFEALKAYLRSQALEFAVRTLAGRRNRDGCNRLQQAGCRPAMPAATPRPSPRCSGRCRCRRLASGFSPLACRRVAGLTASLVSFAESSVLPPSWPERGWAPSA